VSPLPDDSFIKTRNSRRSRFPATAFFSALSRAEVGAGERIKMPATKTGTAQREELCKNLAAASDEMDGILKKAEEEKRPLSEDERKHFDELDAKCKPIQQELEQIDADRKRRDRQSLRRKMLEGPGPRQTTPAPLDDGFLDPSELTAKDRQNIRRQYRRAGKLRAFSGEDAQLDAFRCGQWLAATLFGNEKAALWCKEHGVESLAMSTGENTKGGALVIDEFEAALIKLREEYSVTRRVCAVTPMASDTKNKPRRTGGLTAYAIGDNQEVTASDAAYNNVQLVARKWGVLSKHSSELDEDAVISMADELIEEAAYAFSSAEDGAFILGDGTSTYHGIVGVKNAVAAGSVVTAPSGDVSFATLILDTFESMVGKLPEYPGINPVWIISKIGFATSMQRLMDAAGGNTIDHLERGPSGRQFLGYPVVVSQKMPTAPAADATGVVFFGDFRMGALLGDRRATRVLVSRERYLEFDQIGILSTTRFDINVHGRGDASSAGPIISLTLPSS
jgi:HK97 family phage major capsid protein